MPMFTSPDGRILFAMETAGEGDGNSVVYYDGVPVWDRFTWERDHGTPSPRPPRPLPGVPDRPAHNPPLVSPRTREPISVTDERDGTIIPRMMSDRANALVMNGDALVFFGTSNGPRFSRVNLTTGAVTRYGNLVAYGGETEGWYWMEDGRLVLPYGQVLLRIHPLTQVTEILIDISVTHPGCDLWQPHSSADGQTHSATVRKIVNEGKYPYIGTVVSYRGQQIFFDAHGTLDESQCDDNYVVIKETPFGEPEGNNDNRIINLETRVTVTILDRDRAVGHSDMRDGFLIGEADKPDPGGCVAWRLDRLNESPRFLFPSINMGYISYRNGVCINSNDTHLSRVALDGSGLTPLVTLEHPASPSSPDYYDQRAKGNLDDSATVVTYMDGGVVKLLVL